MRQLIPIDTTDLPDIFDIQLPDGGTYTFRIDYNSYGDYYTCTIKDSVDTTLITQEPLLLGNLVGIAIPNSSLPRVDLRVMDESRQSTDAGAGNFGDDNLVQLYIDELVVLVWATPEFTQFSFLHIVKCDWVFLWEVVSYNIVHVILYSFGRSVCMSSMAKGLVIIPKFSNVSAVSAGCEYGLMERAARNCNWMVL